MSESTELARVSVPTDGVTALAMLDDNTFEERIATMKRGQDRIRRIQRELMIGPTKDDPEGEDYGIIPGTKKPTLLQPGAEKLCKFYGLVPTFSEQIIQGDGRTVPHLRVVMRCEMRHGDEHGPIAAVGYGAANSWEKKHRYRRGENVCPVCGSPTVMRSKDRTTKEFNGDWFCWAKKGGCGAEFKSGSEAVSVIESQVVGDVENPDPYEAENTLLKIAKKRALVDATKLATATSGLFTQDAEDLEAHHGKGEAAKHKPAPAPAPATTNGNGTAKPYQSNDEWSKSLTDRIRDREGVLIAAGKCFAGQLLETIEQSWSEAGLSDLPSKWSRAEQTVGVGLVKATIAEFESKPRPENMDADQVYEEESEASLRTTGMNV